MSSIIRQELAARGVAQVLVFLKDPVATRASASKTSATAGTSRAGKYRGAVGSLSKYFTSAETSQVSQLQVAAEREGRALRASLRGAPPPSTGRARVEAPTVRFYPNLGIMMGTASRTGLAGLRADSRVSHVAGAPPISLIGPTAKASARLSARLTWGLRAMKVESLWKRDLTGKGILVGHLDTGVDGRHPALKGAIAHFAEFDDLGREVRPTPEPFDTEDHGTHTAATIAGRAVGRRHIGVAPGARLASAIVIEGGDVLARVLGGMDWAVGKKVRVLSMSLGFQGWWEDFRALTRLLRARGILPVFAVGNEGPGTSRSPGNYAEVLSVGAYDRSRFVADFSSSQIFVRKKDPIVPDLVMPGVNVISAEPGGKYQSMDGTSMSTPHMAGLAALLMEACPDRSIDEVEDAIFESCILPEKMTRERANRGIPDARKALKLLC